MKKKVVNLMNKEVSEVELPESVFGIKVFPDVLHQYIRYQNAKSRQGTHKTKTRSEVNGRAKKPFAQKGRGVARAGTIRSPIWKGGGVVFGPEPHGYDTKMPKKMRRLARRSVLSDKASAGDLVVVDEIVVDNGKTKEFIEILKALSLEGRKLTILVASDNEKVFLAARNIPNIYVVQATSASTYDLLDCEVLLFEKAALALLNDSLIVKS